MEYAYDEATLDLLRLTIPTYGILVPILLRSGTNETIDGRHRMRVRDELKAEGIEITLPVHHIDTEDPDQIDAIVNSIRRPWQDTEQRRQLVAQLKERGHSNACIAQAVGVHKTTIAEDLANQAATVGNPTVAAKPVQSITGKDGKMRKPPASPEEVATAWAMKDSGMSTPAIALDIGRGERTVRDWFAKERPEATQQQPRDPAPAAAPPMEIPPEPAKSAPKPSGVIVPDNLRKAHQKELKRIKERWIPIAQHLKEAHDLIRAEKDRLCREYAGAHGSLIMQRRWQQLAEAWTEAGALDVFAEITGESSADTLPGLLAELERATRMANGWVGCVATYTGCKPDPNRYQAAVQDQSHQG